MSQANERTAALIELLAAEGVATTDVATRSVAIYPHYDDKNRKLVGYEATNELVVVLRDLVARRIGDRRSGERGR